MHGDAMTPRTTRKDFIAGISVAGLLLPEAVAYASIAGLEPQHALFAAVAGLLVYASIGQSRFAIVAPTSSSAAIIAAAAASVSDNLTAADRVLLMTGAVLLTGAFFLVAGLARLGNLSSFISRPVLRGFAFGIAATIVSKQAAAMMGIHGLSGDAFEVVFRLFQRSGGTNIPSLAIGLVSLVLLLALRRYPILPSAFLVLAAGIALSFNVDLAAHGVALVGKIDIEPMLPDVPNLTWVQWSRLGQVALPLFLIVFAESWGAMRTLGLRHGDGLNPNRELIALGAANLVSGLVRGMPVGAGFSASSANEAAGSASRLSGAIAAILIVVLIAAAGNLIERVPEPVLAAVVIVALLHSLDPSPIVRLWRINRDQYIAVAAALGVMVLGVVNGMLLAVVLAIAATLQRLSQPKVVELGRLRNTHDFVEATHPEAAIDPRVAVLRPSQPLFFANTESVFADVAERVDKDPGLRAVILSLEETTSLDATALDGLIECDARLRRAGRKLFLARVKQSIIDTLTKAGANDLASKEVRHWSVAGAWDEAMLMLDGEAAPRPSPPSDDDTG
jgi:high affinity sulfate transporter 1